MAETSTMNPDNKVEQSEKKEDLEGIKTEVEVLVKRELLECVVCAARSRDCVDIHCAQTAASGAKLSQLLSRLTRVDLAAHAACSKYMCKTCYDLVNVLEQAEIEYNKLKETFEAIISKNPLFEQRNNFVQPITLNAVKAEVSAGNDEDYVCDNMDDDSDDEPLATQSKRKRHKVEKKKKKSTTSKRKVKSKGNIDR